MRGFHQTFFDRGGQAAAESRVLLMKLSAEITVSPVQSEASFWEFLRLPWHIYQGDPLWVPPFSPISAGFWIPGTGTSLRLARLAIFWPAKMAGPSGVCPPTSIGSMNPFTARKPASSDSSNVSRTKTWPRPCSRRPAAWLRERGKTRLVGPLNFGIYDEMGLLVEGFDTMPVLFQTHNPPYYQDLLTSLGFVQAMDWHAYKITNREVDLEAMEQRYADIMRGQNLQIVTYDPKEVDRRADEVFQLFNTAWTPNWGHVPLTRRQFDDMFEMVKPCLRPGMAYALLDDDRMIGFSIALPDLNPLIRKLNGRLTLWGKLRLLYWAKYRPLHKIRAMMVGISQPYQRRHLHLAMILRSYIYLVKHTSWEFCDLSLIPCNLKHWIKVILALDGQRYKVFRCL